MFKAIKRLFCENGHRSLQLVQWMSCVVVILRERESLLSVTGSSSGISSSQESIICGETAACLCPMSTDKQQPDYNHLSNTGLLRRQSSMSSLKRQKLTCTVKVRIISPQGDMERFPKILSNVCIVHKTLQSNTVINVRAISWYI